MIATVVLSVLAGGAGAEGLKAGEVLGILEEPMGQGDLLAPHLLQNDRTVIAADSVHRIYAEGETSYFVAESEDGEICVVVYFHRSAEHWLSALTCAAPRMVLESGLRLDFRAKTDGLDAQLLADGAATPALLEQVELAGGRVPVANLVIFDPGMRPHELDVLSGQNVVLPLGDTTSKDHK
jgi:hypothetical protein